MLKSNKGVTLVALVITIIVLLILAGVSISLVAGDNGVLNQAVNAADNTNKAAVQSELEMAVSAVQADWAAEKYGGTSTKTLKEYVTESKLTANMDDDFTTDFSFTEFSSESDAGKVSITYKGTTYTTTLKLTDSGNSIKVPDVK